MVLWAKLKPKPARAGGVALEQAVEDYLRERKLAEATIRCYRDAYRRFLAPWGNRTLWEIGQDRLGVRRLVSQVSRQHGPALANHVLRVLSAVYRWWRKVDPELPEPPTVAVTANPIKPRDWAMSDEELREWWAAVKRLRNPVKQAWWVTVLLTGARKRSVEHLRWEDVDFSKGIIRFSVTKRAPYAVPMCSRLRELLVTWREASAPVAGEWVFPSLRKDGPMRDVRDDRRGVKSPHRLRHTYRTTLAALGAPPDVARLLLGHAPGRDVSAAYITAGAPALVEALREWAERVCQAYERVLGEPLRLEFANGA